MAKNTYPYLTEVKDPPTQRLFQILLEQVQALQAGTQAQKGHLNMGRNRVRNVATPVEQDDAVTLGHLQQQLAALRQELTQRGASGLTGQLAEPQVPRIIDIDPSQDLPDKTIAQPYMMVRRGAGNLFFFDPKVNDWVQV